MFPSGSDAPGSLAPRLGDNAARGGATRIERDSGAAEQIRAIGERIDRAAVVEEFLTAFRAGITSYAKLSDEIVVGEILETVRRNVDLFFSVCVDGEEIGSADLDAFKRSARNRAAEGIPLEDMLHGYRLGGRIGWQSMVAVAEEGERDGLLLASELLMDYVDTLTSAVAQAYLDERQRLVSEEERRSRELIEALASPEPLSARAREDLERSGLGAREEFLPFVQSVAGASAANAAWAASLRLGGVIAVTEADRVAGLAAADAKRATLAAPSALIAFGPPTRRHGITAAFTQLRDVIDLATALGRSGEIELSEFLPELLLHRSPELAAGLVAQVLGPLDDYAAKRDTELVETLETFVETRLDRSGSAQALHVHPNTLDYRLKRITELTGLDLGDPDSLARVVLALKARAFANGSRTS